MRHTHTITGMDAPADGTQLIKGRDTSATVGLLLNRNDGSRLTLVAAEINNWMGKLEKENIAKIVFGEL